MTSIYRDLTCEFLDNHPPVALINQWLDHSELFQGKSKHKHWGFFLRHWDSPTLIHWFRHTAIADQFQDLLFTNPAALAKAQAIAPDLPWDALRLEWEVRKEAEFTHMAIHKSEGDFEDHIPPGRGLGEDPLLRLHVPPRPFIAGFSEPAPGAGAGLPAPGDESIYRDRYWRADLGHLLGLGTKGLLQSR